MPLPRDKYWQGNKKKTICFAAVEVGSNLKQVKLLPAA